ncbi:MAG: redoxin family protein [Myxococcales bacterium]|nr:redoxin family protein [Myxococcales bacterium]
MTADHPLRRHLLTTLAIILVGGTLLLRLWQGAATEDRGRQVERLQSAAKAEQTDTVIDLTRLDVPLEAIPSSGVKGTHPYLAGLLADHPIVLLNFWASWCPPCLEELRSLQHAARVLAPFGVQVVAVSYDDDWLAQIRVFKELLGTATPPHVLWLRDPQGQDGQTAKMMRTALGTDKLPETWVLQGDKVVSRFVGAQDWSADATMRYLIALAQAAK